MVRNFDIGGMIRYIINNSPYTVQEVSDKLKEMGYEKVSKSTIYGYENKISMPNADVFLDICMICGCDNPMIYWDNAIKSEYTKEENAIIASYRNLKPSQKDMVLNMLEIDKQKVVEGEYVDSTGNIA